MALKTDEEVRDYLNKKVLLDGIEKDIEQLTRAGSLVRPWTANDKYGSYEIYARFITEADAREIQGLLTKKLEYYRSVIETEIEAMLA